MYAFNARALVEAMHVNPRFTAFRDAFLERKVHYWLKSDEMALHFGIGAHFVQNPHAVEIGTFHGASALFTMAGFASRGEGMLYSVDAHTGFPIFVGTAPEQFTLATFRSHVAHFGLERHVTSLVTESVLAAAIWPARPITSVLIDGDHTYLGCLKDLECWAPKLVDGGLVLIDDADDPCLPELLDVIEDIKALKGLVYRDTIDGIAIFQRDASASGNLIDEINQLCRRKGMRRPSDLSFIQALKPVAGYDPRSVGDDEGRQAVYRYSFLSRCDPGDYVVGDGVDAADASIVDRLIEARGDGRKIKAGAKDIPARSCRLVICHFKDVSKYVKCLKPGGVMMAISSLEPTYENCFTERGRLNKAGIEAGTFFGRVHWGIASPHALSTEGSIAYIETLMTE
jgi:hypothetical protein